MNSKVRNNEASQRKKKVGNFKQVQIAVAEHQDPSQKMSAEKEVTINKIKTMVLIDTGSDLNVIQYHKWKQLKMPRYTKSKSQFEGVGASNYTLGYINAEIIIDNELFSDVFHIIPDQPSIPDIIIGLTLLSQMELTISLTEIRVKKIRKLNEKPIKAISTQKTLKPESEEKMNENEVAIDILKNKNSNSFFHELPFIGYLNEMAKEQFPELIHIRNKEIRNEVENLIRNYKPQKTKTSPIQLKLILTDDIPIYQRARRFPPSERELIEKQVKEWLKEGIIRHSSSDYAVPIVPVPKKDGTKRICVDYRPINKKLIRDRYPLPIIEDQIDALQGARIFTTLDLANGYFHVPVAEESIKYTAFVTNSGQYEFLRAPFGLSNCPSVFQRFINHIFAEFIGEGIMLTYMDDMILPARTEEEALSKLKRVLERAAEYGLQIQWKKCHMLQRSIEFLGLIIQDGNIRSSPNKVKAVSVYKPPRTVKELQRFLGLTNYFRKFIPNYAKIAKPLSDLLRKDHTFVYETEQHTAFQTLKQKITERPVLALFEYGLETEVHTDASKDALGGILLQKSNEDNLFHPICYLSAKTSAQEQKWNSYELEVYAVVIALRKWRIYLLGRPFTLVTDCKAFESAMGMKTVPKIMRWMLEIQQFEMKIIHRPGTQMKHVDALSRICYLTDDALTSILKRNQRDDDRTMAMIEIVQKEGKYRDYILKNGLLYRIVKNQELVVVPGNMHYEIIRRAHEKGHFASQKVQELINKEFYIPNLGEKVNKFVRSCITCILAERKNGKAEGFLHPIDKEDRPLSTLHLDHLGPMPSTTKNYKHILTIVDGFTKFIWIFAVKSTTSDETLKKLKIVTGIFGNPWRIVTDRGTAFTGAIFKEFCQEQKIELIHTTTGIPRGNGQVERIHRTIIPALTKLSIEEPEKWFIHVRSLQLFINKTYSQAIGMTPAELFFGIQLKSNNDRKIQEIINHEIAESFVEDRHELRQHARSQILRMQQHNEASYNAKRKKAHSYNIGDHVAIKRTQFGSGLKIKPKHFGPYQVIQSKGHERYTVEKIGSHDGPFRTETSADNMKLWPQDEQSFQI